MNDEQGGVSFEGESHKQTRFVVGSEKVVTENIWQYTRGRFEGCAYIVCKLTPPKFKAKQKSPPNKLGETTPATACNHNNRVVTVTGFADTHYSIRSWCPDCLTGSDYAVLAKMKAKVLYSLIECPVCGKPVDCIDSKIFVCKNYECNLYNLAFEIGKASMKLIGDMRAE